MTTSEELETLEPESVPQEISHYVIDPSLARAQGRSLAIILLGHRCESCRERLEANGEIPTEEQHIKEISKCCSTREGFIRPEMPLQDIVLRTLIAEANRPVSLERLHYLVTEGWYSPINPRSLSQDALKRVLDYDEYYGFKEVLIPLKK